MTSMPRPTPSPIPILSREVRSDELVLVSVLLGVLRAEVTVAVGAAGAPAALGEVLEADVLELGLLVEVVEIFEFTSVASRAETKLGSRYVKVTGYVELKLDVR